MKQQTLAIGDDDAGRLDRFLAARFPEHSRSFLQRLIADGNVTIDGAPVRKSLTLKPGMTLAIDWPEVKPLTLVAEQIGLPVLYEDEEILVINKPAGITVHPGAGNRGGTLVNALLGYDYEQFKQMVDADLRPGIVHRLDKDTTGVMVVARTPQAKARLGAAFASRNVTKQYLALTDGRLPRPQMRVKNRIGRHPRQRKLMTVLETGGRSAISIFHELGHVADLSLVLARIETGRTHQIRVHLQHLGCPVVGDHAYGRRRSRFTAARQLLHAWRLTFPHPQTGEPCTHVAPIPDDFRELALAHGLVLPDAPPAD